MKNLNIIRITREEDAQMHTLEAIMAATIMVVIILFAVQATSLTPLTSSTANAHIESQMYIIGQDMLTALDHSSNGQNSDLKNETINWNGEMYVWNGTDYQSDDNKNNSLEGPVVDLIKPILVDNGIAHNIEFTYSSISESENYTRYSEKLENYYIYNGDPSDNAVIVSRKVLLSESDVGSSYEAVTGIPDVDGNATALYNIIDVKLTLWRM
ncbi:DUF7288 family protein [Methanococcoides sp. LMO-2]|uniref:Uncharacterized protein n=1 Tax=Methanococcoides cohabitans TaxID=3136559 RepID=A0ABU9KVE2_9EURY